MHVIDFSKFIPEHTLIFDVPAIDGAMSRWEVPPFDEETELAFWEWMQPLMEQRKTEQQLAMGVAPAGKKASKAQAKGRFWAPLLAKVVKNVQLDPEVLCRDYHGEVLKMVGTAVVDFFVSGQLPTPLAPASPDESQPPTT